MIKKDKWIHAFQMMKATNPVYYVFEYLCAKGMFKNMSDEQYIRTLYKLFYHREPNLTDPKLFSEKIQWIKLNYHTPLYTTAVDKYDVKQYVSEKIGAEHVIPCLGVWEHPEDIDFDSLPNSVVLKATHDSGGVQVIRDKDKFDLEGVRQFLSGRLSRNFYYGSREWQYKNVKPRIIAEPYIESLGKENSTEYKITCINGKVAFVTVCKGIAHSRLDYRFNDFYDRDLNKLDMVTNYYANSKSDTVFPDCIHEMIEASEKLAEDFPTVRVDFYVDNNDFMFGELTFSTWGGFFKFTPDYWDKKLGDELKLPSL